MAGINIDRLEGFIFHKFKKSYRNMLLDGQEIDAMLSHEIGYFKNTDYSCYQLFCYMKANKEIISDNKTKRRIINAYNTKLKDRQEEEKKIQRVIKKYHKRKNTQKRSRKKQMKSRKRKTTRKKTKRRKLK